MSSVRGNTDGPDEARILSLPLGGRKFEFIDRKPLSDLHVLQRETFSRTRFIIALSWFAFILLSGLGMMGLSPLAKTFAHYVLSIQKCP